MNLIAQLSGQETSKRTAHGRTEYCIRICIWIWISCIWISCDLLRESVFSCRCPASPSSVSGNLFGTRNTDRRKDLGDTVRQRCARRLCAFRALLGNWAPVLNFPNVLSSELYAYKGDCDHEANFEDQTVRKHAWVIIAGQRGFCVQNAPGVWKKRKTGWTVKLRVFWPQCSVQRVTETSVISFGSKKKKKKVLPWHKSSISPGVLYLQV